MSPAHSLPPDTHQAQADRVALYCERHPGQYFTAAELGEACDLGSATKVLSAMAARTGLGYGLAKDWRHTVCASGTRTRRVRTYRVTHRPQGEQRPLAFDA
jgi:hypothetical protein